MVSINNDLLQLVYLKSNNVKKVKSDVNGNPFIIPLNKKNIELYKRILNNFGDYYAFIKDIDTPDYKDIGKYYKLKYELKSFEELVTEYNTLKNELDVERKHKKVAKKNTFFNEEEENAFKHANTIVGESDASYMFLGAYHMALFYKNISRSKSVMFMKEALKIARIQENQDGVKICKKGLKRIKNET